MARTGTNVIGTIPAGSGATVMHAELARRIPEYELRTYSPWLQLFPPLMRRIASRARPDVVHAPLEYGSWLGRRDARLVVTAHSYVLDRGIRKYVSPLQYLHYRTDLRWFARRTAERADAVVAVSHFVARMLADDLGVTRSVSVIYNGIDVHRFRPRAGNRCIGTFRVLFCGNLKPLKRPNLLVPLARTLGPRFEILYTGGLSGSTGNYDAGTKAARLTGVGQVAHADMPALYASVDLLFVPSAREGFGLCVAEAMACAIPVVAADAGALPELVVEGAGGRLCAIDDVAAFAESISEIAADSRLAARYGDFNRQRATELFRADDMARRYNDLFEAVAAAPCR